ncbi:hypothetical protein [Dietzia sp. PP-33]|jgi:hypothetical protein|uniref:hypothetical protein n=1 Tax=Dietzia sp. PP-33 TaxID=2957500 RepID=UPI0029BE810E|nr:hypothetical protein [Dietzia sp. PP-33]MDX2356146.1 hypothetical protein [Dietzia sp. PP-33]
MSSMTNEGTDHMLKNLDHDQRFLRAVSLSGSDGTAIAAIVMRGGLPMISLGGSFGSVTLTAAQTAALSDQLREWATLTAEAEALTAQDRYSAECASEDAAVLRRGIAQRVERMIAPESGKVYRPTAAEVGRRVLHP